MVKKIFLAGLLAGLGVFVWSSISHIVLPIGEAGIRYLPNESAVVSTLRENLSESGFYFFPGMQIDKTLSAEQQQAAQKAWQEKYRQGPVGILVYHPAGMEPFSITQLLLELLFDIFAAWVAAYLLSNTLGTAMGFWRRVLFVALLGLFASFVIDFSYWNWYGFPTSFTLAALSDQVIGWGVAGLILAALIKPQAKATTVTG
ncbi:MAG: hypothetical protein D6814_17875 [Calditrichaeota bacterium]|nr:MAG: hypothetical protein D6814_17875 [Calditrichota bacterium]